VPVVGTRVSEMDEVLGAKAGIRADNWEEFALWIKRLCREDPLRVALGERGRAFAAGRSWEHVATEYGNLLSRIAG